MERHELGFRQRWRSWAPFVCIFVIALTLRLIALQLAPVTELYADEPSLLKYATNVANGLYYGTKGVYWPPGFIFLYGFMIRIFGPAKHIVALRYLQALLGAGTAVLVQLWARRTAGWMAGMIAGLIWSFHVAAIFYTTRIFSETLFIAMMLAMILLWVAYGEAPSYRRLIVAAVVTGLTGLVRPILLPLPGLIFLSFLLKGWPFKRVLQQGMIALAVILLTIAPWTIRNKLVTGHAVLVDMNGGLNFYLGHNPRANGTWVYMGENDPIVSLDDDPKVESLGMKAGWAYLISHPQHELQLLKQKSSSFWWDEDYHVPWRAPALANKFPPLTIRFLTPLAAIGSLLLLRKWRQHFILLSFVPYYYLLIMAIYYAPRYRLVIEPVLAVLAGVALAWPISFVLRRIRPARGKLTLYAIHDEHGGHSPKGHGA